MSLSQSSLVSRWLTYTPAFPSFVNLSHVPD
jgi:hypothetical protein